MKKILKSTVFVTAFLGLSSSLHTQVSVNVGLSVRVTPPVLPVYAQPVYPGYWGSHVGLYGEINYGFGYGGVGFGGGYWTGNVNRYNTDVTNVNTILMLTIR